MHKNSIDKNYKVKKTIIILLFVFFLPCGQSSQAIAQNIDSLYTIWQTESFSDSIRANALKDYILKGFLSTNPDSAVNLTIKLSAFGKECNNKRIVADGLRLNGTANYFLGNYSSALVSFDSAFALAVQIEDKKSMAQLHNGVGVINLAQGDYNKALYRFMKSKEIREELGETKHLYGILSNIGSIYFKQGNSSNALDYFNRALVSAEKTNNRAGISTCLNNIGGIYSSQGNTEKALEYHTRALAIREDLGDRLGVATSLYNLAEIYLDEKEYGKAMDYYKRAHTEQKEVGDKFGMAKSLAGIGRVYYSERKYQKSLQFYQEALAIYKSMGNKAEISKILSSIGVNFSAQQNFGKAIKYCEEALMLAEEIESLTKQKEACECLYVNYKESGNIEEALGSMEKVRLIDNKLSAQETNEKLQQMEFAKQVLQDSIQNAEKERLVKEMHQEQVREKNQTKNIFVVVGCIALLVAFGFFTRWRYIKKSREVLQSEKDRSDSLLLNILPEEIALELKEKGSADARNFDGVSILFTDFKGFTEQSAKLSPEELVNEINQCFKAFDEIMGKRDIEKIKTIGDAYMAAGGLPVSSKNSVKNTVLAALELQKFIKKRKEERDAKGELAFSMRAGIHTGSVVAGIVGAKKFQYDIWGDTVNTASRMESSGEEGKVNISETTYNLLKDYNEFTFEYRGEIETKGKGKLKMYFVSLNQES